MSRATLTAAKRRELYEWVTEHPGLLHGGVCLALTRAEIALLGRDSPRVGYPELELLRPTRRECLPPYPTEPEALWFGWWYPVDPAADNDRLTLLAMLITLTFEEDPK